MSGKCGNNNNNNSDNPLTSRRTDRGKKQQFGLVRGVTAKGAAATPCKLREKNI